MRRIVLILITVLMPTTSWRTIQSKKIISSILGMQRDNMISEIVLII